MSDAIQTGLMLFAVGMITVFSVLAIVVLTGKFLIGIVNRIIPEVNLANGSGRTKAPSTSVSRDKRKVAAVITAAMITTKGKGRITKIERKGDE